MMILSIFCVDTTFLERKQSCEVFNVIKIRAHKYILLYIPIDISMHIRRESRAYKTRKISERTHTLFYSLTQT